MKSRVTRLVGVELEVHVLAALAQGGPHLIRAETTILQEPRLLCTLAGRARGRGPKPLAPDGARDFCPVGIRRGERLGNFGVGNALGPELRPDASGTLAPRGV